MTSINFWKAVFAFPSSSILWKFKVDSEYNCCICFQRLTRRDVTLKFSNCMTLRICIQHKYAFFLTFFLFYLIVLFYLDYNKETFCVKKNPCHLIKLGHSSKKCIPRRRFTQSHKFKTDIHHGYTEPITISQRLWQSGRPQHTKTTLMQWKWQSRSKNQNFNLPSTKTRLLLFTCSSERSTLHRMAIYIYINLSVLSR